MIGYIAAVLTMTGFIPQLIKTYRTKSASDISIITILQISLGCLLWLVHGVQVHDPALVMASIVSTFIYMAVCILYIRYK